MTSDFVYNTEVVDEYSGKTLDELLKVLKVHDFDSFSYSFYVGVFNYAIGKEFNVQANKIFFSPKETLLSGFFHDIGKLGMSRDFLRFEGKYNLEMFQEMKKHAMCGYEILKKSKESPRETANTAGYHHCNIDGSGYPGGLFRQDIPAYARLTRISDSVDAFLTRRCYKEGGPAHDAYNDLKNYVSSSYDPNFLEAFRTVHLNVMDECHRIGEDRPSRDLYLDFLIKLYVDIPYLKEPNAMFKFLEEEV